MIACGEIFRNSLSITLRSATSLSKPDIVPSAGICLEEFVVAGKLLDFDAVAKQPSTCCDSQQIPLNTAFATKSIVVLKFMSFQTEPRAY
jgi:hypothetical protein